MKAIVTVTVYPADYERILAGQCDTVKCVTNQAIEVGDSIKIQKCKSDGRRFSELYVIKTVQGVVIVHPVSSMIPIKSIFFA